MESLGNWMENEVLNFAGAVIKCQGTSFGLFEYSVFIPLWPSDQIAWIYFFKNLFKENCLTVLCYNLSVIGKISQFIPKIVISKCFLSEKTLKLMLSTKVDGSGLVTQKCYNPSIMGYSGEDWEGVASMGLGWENCIWRMENTAKTDEMIRYLGGEGWFKVENTKLDLNAVYCLFWARFACIPNFAWFLLPDSYTWKCLIIEIYTKRSMIRVD